MAKFSASIHLPQSSMFTDVYVEANNSQDAERLLKLQYPGYEVTFLREIESSGGSTSQNNSNSTGCAIALVPFIALTLYGVWHVI